MALVTETGSGMSDAESYISVAAADAYHAKRGNDKWSNLDTLEKEIALRKATDFMTATYRERWKGQRVKPTQALDWPRAGVVIDELNTAPGYGFAQLDTTSIPNEVKNACAELAIRASINALIKDQSQEQRVLSKTVGPISIAYDKELPSAPVYTQIDMMLSVLLQGSSAMVKLRRV
jgi:hypothetical protein